MQGGNTSEPSRRAIVIAWLPALAYMALIFAISSIRIEAPIVRELPFRDKGVHFVEYAVLGFLCARAALQTWPRHHPIRVLAVGALIASAWGLSDELHQALVPGRTAELADVFADSLGAIFGAGMWGRFFRAR